MPRANDSYTPATIFLTFVVYFISALFFLFLFHFFISRCFLGALHFGCVVELHLYIVKHFSPLKKPHLVAGHFTYYRVLIIRLFSLSRFNTACRLRLSIPYSILGMLKRAFIPKVSLLGYSNYTFSLLQVQRARFRLNEGGRSAAQGNHWAPPLRARAFCFSSP